MAPKRLADLDRRHFRLLLRRFHPTPHPVSPFPLFQRRLENRVSRVSGRFVVGEEEVPAVAGKLLRRGIGRVGGERGGGERVGLGGGVALEVPLGGFGPIIGVREGIVFRSGGIGSLEHNGGEQRGGVLAGGREGRGIVETVVLEDWRARSKKPAQFGERRLNGFFRGGGLLDGSVGGERALWGKGKTWNRGRDGF